jgi:hypothetical protein
VLTEVRFLGYPFSLAEKFGKVNTMNKLDYKVQQSNLASVVSNLINIQDSTKRDRRTPSDIVTSITLIISALRKNKSIAEAKLYDLEDNMWMVSAALERLLGIGIELKMIDVVD